MAEPSEDFILEIFNNCVWVEDTDIQGNIFMFYDPIHIRKVKMNSVGSPKDIKFVNSSESVKMFYQDHKKGLFGVSFKYWRSLMIHYNMKHEDIINLVKKILISKNINLEPTAMSAKGII